jgi:glucosamine-6-phosphate deaminase
MVREQVFGELTAHIGRDPDEMAAAAATASVETLTAAVGNRGEASAMFATGNSQIEFLEALVEAGSVDWSRVRVFHMDEYVGVGDDHPAGFARYIRERISDRVHPMEAHYVRGDRNDPAAECQRYGALLALHPLDLCCLGIGENGHLAFNDPPVADFDDPLMVKVVELDEPCRRQQVGEGHFADVASVPTHAITVTIPALLSAARVVAIVPEARKAQPVLRALTGPVSTACPASLLRTRSNVELFLDEDSAQLLPPT